jgi:hypothetical protein
MFETVPIPIYVQLADLMRYRVKKGIWPQDRSEYLNSKRLALFKGPRFPVRGRVSRHWLPLSKLCAYHSSNEWSRA